MASSSAGKARVEEAQHSLARGFGRAIIERVDRLVGFFLARPARHPHGNLARQLARLMDIPGQVETGPHQGAVCTKTHRLGIGRFAVAVVAGERQRVARPMGAVGHVGARTLDDLREDRFGHCLHLRSLALAAYATSPIRSCCARASSANRRAQGVISQGIPKLWSMAAGLLASSELPSVWPRFRPGCFTYSTYGRV